jgi:hypothetical protein
VVLPHADAVVEYGREGRCRAGLQVVGRECKVEAVERVEKETVRKLLAWLSAAGSLIAATVCGLLPTPVSAARRSQKAMVNEALETGSWCASLPLYVKSRRGATSQGSNELGQATPNAACVTGRRKGWRIGESNPGSIGCPPCALPTELKA